MQVTNNINSSVSANKFVRYKQSRYRKMYYFSEYDLIIPSPLMGVLDRNKVYLLESAKSIQLDTGYHYRPDLFCYDTYSDPGYYFILLYVNDMFSMLDFKTETIKVPESARVNDVLALYESTDIFHTVDAEVSI